MERWLLEYIVNSAWQVPLVAVASWVGLRVGAASVRMQHAVWLTALGVAVVLPGIPMRHAEGAATAVPVANTRAIERGVKLEDSRGLTESPVALGEVSSVPGDYRHGWKPLRIAGDWNFSAGAIQAICRLYLGMIAFGFTRLCWSWYAGRRLLRESTAAKLSPVHEAWVRRCCVDLGVEVPAVRRSARAWSPVVIGARRPVVLLPDGFACGAEPEDVEAVWWHELVHVRRRDYLVNLLCRIGVIPIVYHPAAYFVLRRVRRTRELVCDAVAAEKMNSPVAYARCLVEMADRAGGAAVAGVEGTAMLGDGSLEERVMELLRTRDKVGVGMHVTRAAVSAACVAAVLGAAVFFRVTPIRAEVPSGPVQSVNAADFAEPGERVAQAPAVLNTRKVPIFTSVQSGGSRQSVAFGRPDRSARPGADLVLTLLSTDNGSTRASMEYLKQLDAVVQRNWTAVMPTHALGSQSKSGVTKILLKIDRSGKVASLALKQTSGEVGLDKAAWSSLVAGNLPQFRAGMHDQLELGAQFFYNTPTKFLTGWGSGLLNAVAEGQSGQATKGENDLYARAMEAKATGSFATERSILQSLIDTYPNSSYLADAKRAVAQSWDAEGTLALVHAEDDYQAAGVNPRKLGGGITPPVLIYAANPDYTAEARAAKFMGVVMVNLWVDEQGNVQHVRVLRGVGMGLDEKAMDAARQYKFKPAIENGKPVMVAINVEVNFQMF